MYHLTCCTYVGDDKPQLRDIFRHVIPHYATKWRELGEVLGMTSTQLDIISCDYPSSCEERCREMLVKWLNQDISPTWGKLVDATHTIIKGSKANILYE